MCQSKNNKIKNKQIKESIKIIVDNKKCNKCKNIWPKNHFTEDVHQLTGLSKWCKDCHSQYYKDNRDIITVRNIKSQQKYKLKNNLRKKKWALDNQNKVKEASKLYYNTNKEKIAKFAKENRNILVGRSNAARYRARKRKNTIQYFTKKQLEQRMSIFGFKCAYCAGEFDHIDHVKPISKGGYHCLSNLRPACKRCNLEKYNKNLKEWLISRKL
jgi:5-methylcytosine-specific restriction endonuclease McrA